MKVKGEYGYTGKGSNSVIFILPLFCNCGQLLKKRICSKEQILSSMSRRHKPYCPQAAKNSMEFCRSECNRVKEKIMSFRMPQRLFPFDEMTGKIPWTFVHTPYSNLYTKAKFLQSSECNRVKEKTLLSRKPQRLFPFDELTGKTMDVCPYSLKQLLHQSQVFTAML